jgi:glycosyltransferase involved in cell wall biosynthesis
VLIKPVRISIFSAMRVTQIMLSKGFGGAERAFVDTALALARRGHAVQTISDRRFSHQHLLENVANLTPETIRSGSELNVIPPLRIAALLRRFRSEVVHTQLKRAAWHGGRGAFLAGVPVTSKLHNYVLLNRYRYIHTLIATTEDQRKHAVHLGWNPDHVVVIPNFSRVIPIHRREREPGPLRLLSYGRYVEKKGFDLLLKAFRGVLDAGLDAVLLIGGKGPELHKLNALCEKLGLTGKVNLGVWLDDVTSFLDQSDLFVLPSRDEPFGIVMLEAMARGVPIVTTRTQGPSQVLSENTAYFAEPDSVESLTCAVLDAATHSEKSNRKAEAALELYRTTYYEDAVIPRIEELYKKMLQRKDRTARHHLQ